MPTVHLWWFHERSWLFFGSTHHHMRIRAVSGQGFSLTNLRNRRTSVTLMYTCTYVSGLHTGFGLNLGGGGGSMQYGSVIVSRQDGTGGKG